MTPSIENTNVGIKNNDDSYLSDQIELRRHTLLAWESGSIFDINLCIGQQISNKEKIEYFAKNMGSGEHLFFQQLN